MKLFGDRSKKEKNNNIPIEEENKQFFSCEDMEFKDFHEEKVTKFITSKEEFLSKADINSKDFKYIVLACFKVVCEKSKISIILNSPLESIEVYVMSLIIFIKRCIPGEIIMHLNFSCENEKIIIYSGENKKKLKKIKDEYCFDFKREKFILGNMDIESSYLNFVFDNLNEKEKIKNLKSIAENTVYNKVNINEYDDITEIFILNENREKLDSEDMLNFLKNLYENIIKSQDEVRKKNYVKFFFNVFEEEFKNKKVKREKYTPNENTIDMILSSYKYVDTCFDEEFGENIKKTINAYLLLVIVDAKTAQNLNYIKSVFYKANTNPVIFRKLIDILFVNNTFVEDILKWYILDEIGESRDLRDVLKHISFWAKTSPKVISMDFFGEFVENKIIDIIEERETKVDEYTITYNYLKDFHRLCPTADDKDKYVEFQTRIKKKIYGYMLEAIDLNKVNYENILAIELEKPQHKEDTKYMSIYYLQALLNRESKIKLREIENFICSLSREEMFNLEHLIREYYKQDVVRENFRNIMVAFAEQTVYANDTVLYNVNELMKYINDNSGNDKAREYIAWVSDNFEDLDKPIVEGRFKSGLFAYFYELDTEAFKDSSFNKILANIENKNMKKMLREIRKQLPGNFKKIVNKISNSKTYY